MSRFCLILVAVAGARLNAGELDPPAGPIAPTMKDLATVEPRVPISTLPFVITAPGSYYLTASLQGVAGADGISVAATDVTLDLMGFTLSGVPGSLSGITFSSGADNCRVHGGTVRGWGGDGLRFDGGENQSVESVSAFENGGRGIALPNRAEIRSCSAADNLGDGIAVGSACVISDCVSSLNDGRGFMCGLGVVLEQCIARDNQGAGIETGNNAVIRGSSALGSGGSGIIIDNGSVISNSVSSGNDQDGIFGDQGVSVIDCVCTSNSGDGIEVTSDGIVRGNTCDGNQAGIFVTGSDNRIDANNVTDNARGIDVDGTGNIIVRNTASGNSGNIHYSIVANNAVGPVIMTSASGAINGPTGSGSLNTSDPWANFSY